MSKTFVAKTGDKWTRDEDGMLWVYRKDCVVVFSRTGFTAGPVTCRSAHETDLPTPDAHAQLREWGYEVTGEQLAGDEQPITESRVREIVAQMLAAQPTPAEVREAAPEPDWKGLLANLVEAWKKAAFSSGGDAGWLADFLNSPALAAAREHLARTNGGGK